MSNKIKSNYATKSDSITTAQISALSLFCKGIQHDKLQLIARAKNAIDEIYTDGDPNRKLMLELLDYQAKLLVEEDDTQPFTQLVEQLEAVLSEHHSDDVINNQGSRCR